MKEKLNVLDWPWNSPNLNPIQNLWSIKKSRWQKLYFTTTTKRTEAIIRVWYRGIVNQRKQSKTG